MIYITAADRSLQKDHVRQPFEMRIAGKDGNAVGTGGFVNNGVGKSDTGMGRAHHFSNSSHGRCYLH